MESTEKKAVISGEYGFEGKEAARLLISAGYQVILTIKKQDTVKIICHQPGRKSAEIQGIDALKRFLKNEYIPPNLIKEL